MRVNPITAGAHAQKVVLGLALVLALAVLVISVFWVDDDESVPASTASVPKPSDPDLQPARTSLTMSSLAVSVQDIQQSTNDYGRLIVRRSTGVDPVVQALVRTLLLPTM